MQKKIILLFIIISLLAFGVFYVKGNLNQYIRDYIISYVSQITKTNVELESVDINIKDGMGTFNNFVISNPTMYKSSYILKLQDAQVNIAPTSIFEDTVMINEIILNNTAINYEKNNASSNFSQIQKNIEQVNKQGSEKNLKGKVSGAQEKQEKQEKKFIVKKIDIKNIMVSARIAEIKDEIQFKLPDIQILNIGSPTKPLTQSELVQFILLNVEKNVSKGKELLRLEKKLTREIKRIEKQMKSLEEIGVDKDELLKDLKKLF